MSGLFSSGMVRAGAARPGYKNALPRTSRHANTASLHSPAPAPIEMNTLAIVEQALDRKQLKRLLKAVYEFDQRDIFDTALSLQGDGTLTVVYCQPLLDFLPAVLDHVAKYLGLKKLVIQDTVRSFEDIPESCFGIPVEFRFCYAMMGIKNFSSFRAERMCLVDSGGWVRGRLSDGQGNGPNEHVTELHLKLHKDRDKGGVLGIIDDFPNLEKVRISILKRMDEDEENPDAAVDLIKSIPHQASVISGGRYETLYGVPSDNR